MQVDVPAPHWTNRISATAHVVVAMCVLCVLGWLAWSGNTTRLALQEATEQALRVAELKGTIKYLDEWLTMSARMAAATGEASWIARYDEAEPELDAAITEAVALATPEIGTELAHTTDQANQRLVELERSSFALVRAADLTGAAALLNGVEYARLKAVYASGMMAFSHSLEQFAQARTTTLNQHTWVEASSSLVLGALTLLVTVVINRGQAKLKVALTSSIKIARTDALTGLANRRQLLENVAMATARAKRGSRTMAVLILDLDGFKAVNDLHGHATGDRLLCEVAARLRESVRDVDTVARLGGDEFVVLQDSVDQPGDTRALAERLVAALAEPYLLGVIDIQNMVTVSVGVAVFPGDGEDPATLLRNADTALYKAKFSGKNTLAFFQSEMDRELRKRRALERDLRDAASRGEFALAWQPVSLTGHHGPITGFEALLRWHHPKLGLVPPDVFIPVAEACGVIGAIGSWVLREACFEAARWTTPLRVAVNVSPLQAQQGEAFARLVEETLADSGLVPWRLTLEVTEGVLIREADRVLAALGRLKSQGVQVALDDFGTGYSSLATLRAFPFDKIKIDRSFVAGIGVVTHGHDTAIVHAVLGLARGLGLPVVAEGVETEEQRYALREAGCEELQGWLIGRPAPIRTFDHLTLPVSVASAA